VTVPDPPTSYASLDQFEEFVTAIECPDLPDTPSDVQALLDRASEDIDAWLRWPAPPDPEDDGEPPVTRIPAASLTRFERRRLARATIAQALYRVTVGEGELLEGAGRITAAGGISFVTAAPDPIAPAARHALSACPKLTQFAHGIAAGDDDPAAA
jgi:hypothetical protein